MSAFIVSTGTMQRVVTAMHPPARAWEDACQLGQRLYAMNQRAVAYRYAESPPDVAPFQWIVQMLPDGDDRKGWCELLKAVECLIYQCSEGDVPEEMLFKELEQCATHLCEEIAHRLPEYAAAPWDGPWPESVAEAVQPGEDS